MIVGSAQPADSNKIMGERFLPDSLISHYRILSKLGEGGMAEVYLARDMKLGRRVAMKFLPLETAADQHARRRLVREAQAAATLEHQNICAIYEVGEADGHTFIVMQYVDGATLYKFLQGRALDVPTALSLSVQIADALREAHSHGIIHRDLKPQNIMITPRQQAKVMDFGLAKVVDSAEAVESEAKTRSLLTTPGTIIGTIPYMSPEQVRGERTDERSDIFSFGVVFYEMLTGYQPFAAANGVATISAILTKEPEPIQQYLPSCPATLERIVRKCLAKDKGQRYQTMNEVAAELALVQAEDDNGRKEASTAFDLSTGETAAVAAAGTKRKSVFRSHPIAIVTAVLLVLATTAILTYVWKSRRVTESRRPEIRITCCSTSGKSVRRSCSGLFR